MTQSNTLYVGLDVHELTPQLLAHNTQQMERLMIARLASRL
jgi:hypothetical protein